MSSINANKFVSPPLPLENENAENTRMVPVSGGDNTNMMQNAAANKANLDHLYPEIYWDLYPMVAEVAKTMNERGVTPTPDNVGTIVDNIIKNCGLWYEDEDEDDDVIPVQFGFGRFPFQRRRRRFHNRNTLRDLTRILLLRELFGGPFFPIIF